MNDPEYAEAVVLAREENRTLGSDGEPWRPPVEEWDLHAQQLADLRELVVALIDATLTGTNRKPSGMGKFPQPRTAIDQAAEDLHAAQYEEGLAIFAPHALPDRS